MHSGIDGVGKVNLKDHVKSRILFLFARHGRALTGESPEHAQIVGSV